MTFEPYPTLLTPAAHGRAVFSRCPHGTCAVKIPEACGLLQLDDPLEGRDEHVARIATYLAPAGRHLALVHGVLTIIGGSAVDCNECMRLASGWNNWGELLSEVLEQRSVAAGTTRQTGWLACIPSVHRTLSVLLAGLASKPPIVLSTTAVTLLLAGCAENSAVENFLATVEIADSYLAGHAWAEAAVATGMIPRQPQRMVDAVLNGVSQHRQRFASVAVL